MGPAAVNVALWRCKACRKELGRVLDGILRLHDQLVTIDRFGNAAVRCKGCGEVRLWKAA